MKNDGMTGRQQLVHGGTVSSQNLSFLRTLQERLNSNPAGHD